MIDGILIAALAALGVWVVAAWAAWRNATALLPLPAASATPPGGWPAVSLIVPARDEEAALPATLAAWRALDYPRLEVLLVDDHSRDATGALMDAAAAADPRFNVLHDPPLPPGWLGKNNAIQQAAARARGEWLLLTDADVVFAPEVVKAAVALAVGRGLDLLPALLRIQARGLGERVTLPLFGALGLAALPIRRGMDPASRDAMGVGGFTLVRRDAYFACGGHAALPGEVLEDVAFARLAKRHGLRYAIADGTPRLRVRMYHSLAGVVRGFRKNTYAAAERSLAIVLAGIGGILLLGLAPFAALVTGALLALTGEPGATELAAIGAAGFVLALTFLRRIAFLIDAPAWALPLHPAGALVLVAILALSTWDGVVRRQVHWRGRTLDLAPRPGAPPASPPPPPPGG